MDESRGRELQHKIGSDTVRVLKVYASDRKMLRARAGVDSIIDLKCFLFLFYIFTDDMDLYDRRILAARAMGKDQILKTTVADYNLEIMDSALEAGSNYIDFVGGGSREVLSTPEIKEQLALTERVRTIP